MEKSGIPAPSSHRSCGCCCGHAADFVEDEGLTRRTFLAAAGTATVGAALPVLGAAAVSGPGTRARQQPIRVPLRVQPVFQCEIYERKPATSWRVTGAIQDERELQAEETRIRRDLADMTAAANFPLEFRPLVTVRTVEQAKAVVQGDFDVVIIYAARRNLPVLEALAANDKWNLIFVRHQSGPLYYMYIGVHTHFLRKRRDTFGQANMDAHDVVVDDPGELLWRLRALYALKNLTGKRIVAVGQAGGWGADGREAPKRAQDLWKLDIRAVTYPELGERIQKARQNQALVDQCRVAAGKYLKQRGVSLETDRGFVDRAFLLTEVFRDLLDEAQADTITVDACMSTVMPISETTACLPLGVLNDEGYLAFCESDFVVIPTGILLHYIAGTPVFFGNPSLPHRGIVTMSHCTAPSRMDGKRFEPTRVVTHYESDYGAAPKVDMKKGQRITIVNADFNSRRWLGFEAQILDTPFYPICRTQLDLKILGNWERLLDEVKGFHWMAAYGSHLRETGYALKKAGIGWLAVT
ncbi:MAG: sugar isomerase [Planctomycetes bacterium]|jgi:hypothetical protein|nr:sugar isomerase [Planctomycetota bacterium]